MNEPTIPLSHFELDHPEPPDGWPQLLDREGIELTEDDIGRVALTREDAARLLGHLRAEQAYAEDQRRRRQAEQDRRHAELEARHPVSRGVPAIDGLSAAETMLISAGEKPRQSVAAQLREEAFAAGGRPIPTRRERWVEDGSLDGGHWVKEDA